MRQLNFLLFPQCVTMSPEIHERKVNGVLSSLQHTVIKVIRFYGILSRDSDSYTIYLHSHGALSMAFSVICMRYELHRLHGVTLDTAKTASA